MVLCVDVDGVLNNLMDVIIDTYNVKYETEFTANDITTYSLDSCFELSVAKQMKNLFKSSNVWDKVKPLPGAQEGLQKLINDGHQVYIVTDHDPNTYGTKVEWIKRFFPFVDPSKIMCVKDKWMLRADLMIEDNLQTLLAKPYYHRVLMDQPWNQSTHDWAYDVYRCSNWNEIVDAVNKLKEKEEE